MLKSPVFKEFYSTTELADLCNVSPATIFRAVVNKQIRASTTPGGHFRISREDADEFLKKNNIPAPHLKRKIKRILIVEDNPTELRLFQRTLSVEKTFEVKVTSSGYEAGFLTQSFKPDLILLDIFLEDLDGREVARLIRSDPSLKATKIVAITGSRDPKDVKEIRSLGLDGFIQKPIMPLDLFKRVKLYLE